MTPARTNQNWLPGIFNEILGDNWLAERRSTTAPAVNIIDGENEYKVEVAAPGMTKEDFKVHINEDNELVISLEKKTENKEEDAKRKGTYCAANSPTRSSSRACCCPTISSARIFRPRSKTV